MSPNPSLRQLSALIISLSSCLATIRRPCRTNISGREPNPRIVRLAARKSFARSALCRPLFAFVPPGPSMGCQIDINHRLSIVTNAMLARQMINQTLKVTNRYPVAFERHGPLKGVEPHQFALRKHFPNSLQFGSIIAPNGNYVQPCTFRRLAGQAHKGFDRNV